MNRRQFLAASAATAAAQTRSGSLPLPKPRTTPPVCLYSQAVIKIEYADLGPILGGMGFDGCNLSVQAGGHIAPNQASLDLVRAVEAMRGAGVDVPVITTALTAADDPDAREVLGIGGILKVPLFRPGRWKYGAGDIMARLAEVRRSIATLGGLGRAAGMEMAIHNQPGGNVGEAIWDTDAMIRGMDPQAVGYDLDAGYAASGGPDAWTLALRLALPRLKMVTARDLYWAKGEGGWKTTPCPLGEGMVDWPRLFATLARARFMGPISLEIDYEPKNEVAAIQRDLEFLKKQVAAAYSAGPG